MVRIRLVARFENLDFVRNLLFPILKNLSLIRLQLRGAIYRPDSFVMMLRYCANLNAIRYESTNLNRIVADESHRVIVALGIQFREKSMRGGGGHSKVYLPQQSS